MDLNPGVSNPKGKGSARNKGQNAAGGTVEAEEDSESESESSSSSSGSQTELYNFRLAWEAELKKMSAESQLPTSSPLMISQGGITTSMAGVVSTMTGKDIPKPSNLSEQTTTESATVHASTPQVNAASTAIGNIEEQAKMLFLQGVGLERKGELYDAVKFYKRAMQLVPDIEYRVNASYGNNENSHPSSKLGSPDDSEDERNPNDDEDGANDDEPLLKKFLREIEAKDWQFFEKLKPDNKLHLRDIPIEVLSYILRWVVSKELDVRSLDVLSGTSRGFYCICRDEQLWKMACERVWTTCNLLGSPFSSYREMFLKRNRVRFDGCYISRISYIRAGEHSFQDQSYRPWHLVEYYRIIRFFPDGQVYFLTTADHPSAAVGGLKDRQQPRNTATMRGRYWLGSNDVVTVIVKKPVSFSTPKSRKIEIPDITTFHIELEISGLKGRPSWIVKWLNYSVRTCKSGTAVNQQLNNNIFNLNLLNNPENNNAGSFTSFDINPNKFPAMYFSRVKSYTTKAESVLE